MTVHYRHMRIELERQAQAEAWAQELGVSVQALLTAVNAVGNGVQDVRDYLAVFREPMGAYIDKMKARLDEIESQVQRLGEERRSIVTFLEGFAQIQRTQRATSSHEALLLFSTIDDSASSQSRPRHRGDELVAGYIDRVQPGSSAQIVETVYQLLADGRRRSIQDILSFLEVRGVATKGANPSAFLSTLLSRDQRFDANRREGWGLAGKP